MFAISLTQKSLTFDQDLADLVATCQRHTRCSPAYCLRTKNGRQQCRFGYPKPLQANTAIVVENEPTLLTARNDGMINSFNPVQLSAWRANVDMLYIVSRRRVLDYCTKYVTKSEPRSQPLRELFASLAQSLKEGNNISSNGSKTADKLRWREEIILPKKHVISFYSYRCSSHLVNLSFSALMGHVLCTVISQKVMMPPRHLL